MSFDKLVTVICSSEQEYYERFCEEYKDPIITPDGFTIISKDLNRNARHFCCGGKEKKFQRARAERILWAKFILMNKDERYVLLDNKTKNIIFYFIRKKHALICVPQKDGTFDLISSFVVGGQRSIDYLKGNPPYSFYKKS